MGRKVRRAGEQKVLSLEIIGTICVGKIGVCTPGLHAGIRCMAVASLVNNACIMCQRHSRGRGRGARNDIKEVIFSSIIFLGQRPEMLHLKVKARKFTKPVVRQICGKEVEVIRLFNCGDSL